MRKSLLIALSLGMAVMSHAQSRSALIHLKSGEIKEFDVENIDSITFTDPVTYDKTLAATQSMGMYFGNGQYLVELSDQPISNSGLPTVAGQTIVRFDAFGKSSVDSRNAILPSGRYVSSKSMEEGTLYDSSDYLQVMVCTGIDSDGNPLGYSLYFDKSGVANVEYNSDGTYTIDFKGQRTENTDGGIQNLHVTYTGKVAFTNKDPQSYDLLDSDVTMVPTGAVVGYSNIAGSYGNYTCTFYNTPLDADSYVVGAGELMNVELLTEEATPMDLSKIAGTYTPTSATEGPWTPGNWLDGQLYSAYGMTMPIGTYYSTYDADGNKTNMNGFARSGSIVVTVNGDSVNFDCNLVAEGGHTIKMNYTANKSVFVDQSQNSALPAQKSARRGAFTSLRRADSVSGRIPAIRLVKQD